MKRNLPAPSEKPRQAVRDPFLGTQNHVPDLDDVSTAHGNVFARTRTGAPGAAAPRHRRPPPARPSMVLLKGVGVGVGPIVCIHSSREVGRASQGWLGHAGQGQLVPEWPPGIWRLADRGGLFLVITRLASFFTSSLWPRRAML